MTQVLRRGRPTGRRRLGCPAPNPLTGNHVAEHVFPWLQQLLQQKCMAQTSENGGCSDVDCMVRRVAGRRGCGSLDGRSSPGKASCGTGPVFMCGRLRSFSKSGTSLLVPRHVALYHKDLMVMPDAAGPTTRRCCAVQATARKRPSSGAESV